MSTSHRICETCVYCSLAGNCDRYNKPLTSIEQPACDAYEIHPLLAENAKLRGLVRDMHRAICCLIVLGDDYVGEHEDELCALDDRMRELGVEP